MPERKRLPILKGIPLLATLILIANDHWWKRTIDATWWTGKASDVAGMIVLPTLLASLWIALRPQSKPHERQQRQPHPPHAARSLASVCVTLAGSWMVLLKCHPGFNGVVSAWLGPNSMDKTDLWALVALPLAWWCITYTPKAAPTLVSPARQRNAERAAIGAAAIACIATSKVGPTHRSYPYWEIASPPNSQASCAMVSTWVSKSVKNGVGVSMLVQGPPTCPIAPETAELSLGFQGIPMTAAARLVHSATIDAGPLGVTVGRWYYMAFVFDNDRSFDRAIEEGDLVIYMRAGTEPWLYAYSLRQRFPAWEGAP